MNRKFIALWLSLLICLSVSARVKTLSICIGKYPEGSGWNSLGADNDAKLIKCLFPIATIVSNEEATYNKILRSFNNLNKEISVGDTVIVHFSGHGQQILTVSSQNEADMVDEAVVPFDAAKRKSSIYKGQAHLTDDVFGQYMTQLRQKIGSTGLLIAVIDACHSDSMDKDADKSSEVVRGTEEIFGADALTQDSITHLRELYNVKDESSVATSDDMANAVFISACGSNQRNYEIKTDDLSYGSLTFYFCKVFQEKGIKDINDFMSSLYEEMTADKTMKFHGQKPVMRNSLGWNPPQEDGYLPPLPPPLGNDDCDKSLLWLVVGSIVIFSLIIYILCRKRKK